jgi:hypothetical protein
MRFIARKKIQESFTWARMVILLDDTHMNHGAWPFVDDLNKKGSLTEKAHQV